MLVCRHGEQSTSVPVQCLSILTLDVANVSSIGSSSWLLDAAFRNLLCILGLLINTCYTHTARTSCRQVLLHEDSVSTIRHVLDGIVVKDLAGLPGVAPLPQQIPQGLIVHLNEGCLHVIFPARVCQLAGSFQDLQTADIYRNDYNVDCRCIIAAIVH